jgi:hypothetical protein
MFGSFRALRLPKNVQAWSLDRSWDRAEGERLLKARDYPAAEGHLAKAGLWRMLKNAPAAITTR